jgi:asparagine synthetase B (glutamine-hydrolysing)
VPDVAARLPEGALVGEDGETKRALRAALEGRIPEAVRTNRRKRGFPTPFHRAATGAGRDLCEAVLSSAAFRERGWWDVAACRALLDARRPDHDRALFSILLHEAWARRFLDAPRAGGGA